MKSGENSSRHLISLLFAAGTKFFPPFLGKVYKIYLKHLGKMYEISYFCLGKMYY